MILSIGQHIAAMLALLIGSGSVLPSGCLSVGQTATNTVDKRIACCMGFVGCA